MLNFATRLLFFFILLFAGFAFGWEFLVSGVIFFVASGKSRPEFLLLGPILDFSLSFPPVFFTSILFSLFLFSLLEDRFFESKTFFNFIAKAFLMSLLVTAISFLFYTFNFLDEINLTIKYAGTSFAKIFLPLPLLFFLFKLKRASYGKEAFFI
ncbi:hypothetical protein A3B18_01910 [Candidatus Giovannonibacteria bacterium RIFCSPLOWO2_01_FULL_46_13]|uniref:Uncharacterized protein n=1 Tax=Candidatus Giovannonibacteria bacterium RIFCSPLOWO2_01_FULL_46_13 TaxID=1798352 RepID=A0A1F5X2R8_9BACT|nr:MAG: hypothetical protein A3B18_01910 [Candidatus Giovannonibacteria bacterium RIFCSPLOWO2_01_FULL_46_13]